MVPLSPCGPSLILGVELVLDAFLLTRPKAGLSARDQGFESVSLQQGVIGKPFGSQGSSVPRYLIDAGLVLSRVWLPMPSRHSCFAIAGALVSPSSIPRAKSDEASTLRLSSAPNKRPSPPTMTIMASRRKRAVDVSIRAIVVENRTPILSSRPDK